MIALLVAALVLVLGYTLIYKGVSDWNGSSVSFKQALTGNA